jgi:hypothetical protein
MKRMKSKRMKKKRSKPNPKPLNLSPQRVHQSRQRPRLKSNLQMGWKPVLLTIRSNRKKVLLQRQTVLVKRKRQTTKIMQTTKTKRTASRKISQRNALQLVLIDQDIIGLFTQTHQF